MSLTLLASNNASTVLASSINASATTLTVNTGAGSLFPSPVAGTSFFKLTLIDAATGQLTEIVHVTARTGDVMTIERAQEGTAARVWSANDIAANMMTAGTLSYILGSFQPLDATLTALAALIGAADKLPYFNGPGTAALTPLTGVGRDIIGKATIADVLTYLGVTTALASKQPLDATLTALAGLTTGANKLPYFTGTDTAAQTDLTSVGRDIIGKNTIADILTYLGLGNMKYGAPLIGQLIEWPLQKMPHEIWPDMGQEYIPYMAQSFDPVKYPLLSQLHPTNVLPADMRGYVARGWDNGRGIDTNRALMSAQEDAIRNITGTIANDQENGLFWTGVKSATGAFDIVNASGWAANAARITTSTATTLSFSAAKAGIPTAGENRVKSVAWNFIVRAK